MKILVFNAGSSSHKSSLYQIQEAPTAIVPEPLWEGSADWTKEAGKTVLKIKAHGETIEETLPITERVEVIKHLLNSLWSGKTQVLDDISEIAVVGHRVVHGGEDYQQSVIVTPEVKSAIRRLANFAPLHNPANLEGIEAIEQIKSDLPQVAVFDTAFHASLPAEAKIYPGPYTWFREGIRRYGFHGISHQYCARRSAEIVGRDPHELRIITCHLGNGCSLAAIRNGQSIDTTMGFTPLEGLMMGTRSGTVDPSILLYLQRQYGYTTDQLDKILNKESGLLGISGLSGDVRVLEQATAAGHEQARLALDIYIYRIRSFIGALIPALGGLDVLTFTAGVGENAASIRARVCENFAFLNLHIDQKKNERSSDDRDISTSDSTVRVLVVHTQEDWEIARDCWQLVSERKS